MSKRPSRRVAARVVSKHAFARIDPFGVRPLVAHSPEVLGMANCLDSGTRGPRPFGAYCFKLSFTPVAVIANAIAHPLDKAFGPFPVLYTAGPNVTGQFARDQADIGVECPVGFQDAAVVGRYAAGDGITAPFGGLFVMFFG